MILVGPFVWLSKLKDVDNVIMPGKPAQKLRQMLLYWRNAAVGLLTAPSTLLAQSQVICPVFCSLKGEEEQTYVG